MGSDGELIESFEECRVCTNGLIQFWTRSDTGRVFFACEECLMGYWEPPSRGAPTFLFTNEVTWPCRPATRDEVAEAGWSDLVWRRTGTGLVAAPKKEQ